MVSNWTRSYVDSQVAEAKARTLSGTYGLRETAALRDALSLDGGKAIRGASVLVVGSEKPWVEALCLALDLSNTIPAGMVAVPAIEDQRHIDVCDVAFLERFGVRDAVTDHVI